MKNIEDLFKRQLATVVDIDFQDKLARTEDFDIIISHLERGRDNALSRDAEPGMNNQYING
jgi:hypothetical protein